MRIRWLLIASAVLLAVQVASARELTFADRVDAQRAIVQVRYGHQTGARAPFEARVTTQLLEAKVRDYLARSVALEVEWETRLTAEMLHRELSRVKRASRQPERLQELFNALGNDAFLIQECLVRPILVDRLTRRFLASDERVQAESRLLAEQYRYGLLAGRIDPRVESPRRVETLVRQAEAGESRSRSRSITTDPSIKEQRLDAGEFARWRQEHVRELEGVGPVRETRGGYSTSIVIEDEPSRVRLVTYFFPKRSWDEWWDDAKHAFDTHHVVPVADPDVALQLPQRTAAGPEGTLECDVWNNGSLDDYPDARDRHTAVWTGSEMLVWGGNVGIRGVDQGHRYDPATDTWTPISVVGAPERRASHTAVWTGTRMIVWGGNGWGSGNRPVEGGAYDPVIDTWTPTSTVNVPLGRTGHSAVWTGEEMIIWGGSISSSGGRYDPDTDTWATMTLVGAPIGRTDHVAVWTGERMVAWGGFGSGSTYLDSGGIYDPEQDTWTPTSTVGALTGRRNHTATWADGEMLVWGGFDGTSSADSGGRYDPTADRWEPMSTADAPSARSNHSATWTGTEMIVWGGGPRVRSGGRYDPAADSWTPTGETNAPEGRLYPTAIWTGSQVIVWGGNAESGATDTGGRYDPFLDAWTPTSRTPVPDGRGRAAALWTGSEVLIWAGQSDVYGFPGRVPGLRYDPATDSWTLMSITNAPNGYAFETAVWTGTQMLVFDGDVTSTGSYDLLTDTWTPISEVDAPYRGNHTAVWTGERMIVWGGWVLGPKGLTPVNSGAMYDPSSDAWTPMSEQGAPTPRTGHVAVWTGEKMLVWGGYDGTTGLGTGGRYDPAGDTWTPISDVDAASPRFSHGAVWTGSEMIVWGGRFDFDALTSGGRYDPTTDSWTPTDPVGSPTGRNPDDPVWTGTEMIVWGGASDNPANLGSRTGGRYDPATDTWAPTAIVDAPSARYDHVVVWTGRQAWVWGGSASAFRLASGGSYYPGTVSWFPDTDGDGFGRPGPTVQACSPPAGFVGNTADCDADDATVFPGAPERNDGVDNQCPGDEGFGVVDELGPVVRFADPENRDEISWTAQPGATSYEVLSSTAPGFVGDCLSLPTVDTSVTDPRVPVLTGALYYMVRSSAPNAGSLGTASSGTERDPTCR